MVCNFITYCCYVSTWNKLGNPPSIPHLYTCSGPVTFMVLKKLEQDQREAQEVLSEDVSVVDICSSLFVGVNCPTYIK